MSQSFSFIALKKKITILYMYAVTFQLALIRGMNNKNA